MRKILKQNMKQHLQKNHTSEKNVFGVIIPLAAVRTAARGQTNDPIKSGEMTVAKVAATVTTNQENIDTNLKCRMQLNLDWDHR